MTKKRKGSRYTPKKAVIIGADKESLDRFFDSVGVPRMKAAPRSGVCVSCGRKLVPPPEGKDRDHSVCDDCFPEDMKEEWEGRTVDVLGIDADTGEMTEIKPEGN